MSIPLSYMTVILIWSTTPLAIQWSGDDVGFTAGVAIRMSIGLVLMLLILRVRRLPLPFDVRSRTVYLLGGIPMFIAMSSVYWAAQFIPSGWISVIFGLTPIVTSILAARLLDEDAFSDGKLLGMLLGLAGLGIVFFESMQFSDHAWLGVAGVLISVVAHSSSAVLLKRARSSLHGLSIATGGLLIATPLFVLNMFVSGDGLPATIPDRTLYSILYLAVVGSAIGFPLYYYLLTRLSAGRLALITLITPVTALLLGNGFNDEPIPPTVWTGTGFILTGLAAYEYGHRFRLSRGMRKRFSFRWFQRPM